MKFRERERNFAISDIHGCCQTFKRLLKKIKFKKSDHLYIIGDFINKGKDSKELFQLLRKLTMEGRLTLLRGNHEQMMLDVYDGIKKRYLFEKIGGNQTLKSFKVKKVSQLPDELIEFVRSSKLNLIKDNYIMVHGGINFSKNDPMNPNMEQLKLRNWYHKINQDALNGRIILHGHSPVKRTVIEFQYQKMLQRRYLDLDSGCVYTEKKKQLTNGWW